MKFKFQIVFFSVFVELYAFLYANKHYLHISAWYGLQYYFGDFFAPIFTLQIYRITISLVFRKNFQNCRFSLRMAWILIIILTIVFEVILPQIELQNQTSDLVDVFMYLIGGNVAYYFFNGKIPLIR